MTDKPEAMMEPADFAMLARRVDAGSMTEDLFLYMTRNPQAYEVTRKLEEMRQDERSAQCR